MMLVSRVNLIGVSAGARVASLFAVAKLLTPTNAAIRAVHSRSRRWFIVRVGEGSALRSQMDRKLTAWRELPTMPPHVGTRPRKRAGRPVSPLCRNSSAGRAAHS